MSITQFPPFSPQNPWVRPVTAAAWQAEITSLGVAGVHTVPYESHESGFIAGVGWGLLAGYALSLLSAGKNGGLGALLCLSPFVLWGLVACIRASSSACRASRDFVPTPANHRLSNLQQVSGRLPVELFRSIPDAYVEFLEMEKSPVPVLVGDIEYLRQKYNIPRDPSALTGLSWAGIAFGFTALPVMGMGFLVSAFSG